MKKYLCYMAAVLAAANAAEAKRDFYVEKEVRCGAGGMCYEAVSGMPLNGVLRRYYADGMVREDINYANGVKDGVTQLYFPDGEQQAYMVYQNGVLEGGGPPIITAAIWNMKLLMPAVRCTGRARAIMKTER